MRRVSGTKRSVAMLPRANRWWTTREDKILRTMTAAGYSFRTIAATLGRTENSVMSRVSSIRRAEGAEELRRHPPRPKTSQEEREKIVAMARRGIRQADIARYLGRSKATIHRVLKEELGDDQSQED